MNDTMYFNYNKGESRKQGEIGKNYRKNGKCVGLTEKVSGGP